MARNILQPATLPSPHDAINTFVGWRDSPCPLIKHVTPLSLFAGQWGIDIDRVWFVGSCAWMPAVLGRPFDNESDIDIVFADEEQAKTFVENAVAKLACESPIEHQSYNTFGGWKFKRAEPGVTPPSTATANQTTYVKSFMDVWWLPPNESIAEHIMSWKHDHEHVAIMAGASVGEISALTRIVRYTPWGQTDQGKAEKLAEDDAKRQQYLAEHWYSS